MSSNGGGLLFCGLGGSSLTAAVANEFLPLQLPSACLGVAGFTSHLASLITDSRVTAVAVVAVAELATEA